MSDSTTGLGIPTTTAAPAPAVIAFKHGAEAQKFGWWWGTGRRKSAIARVRIRPGDGTFKVNGREINEYFSEERDRGDVVAPLKSTEMLGKIEVQVTTMGGGYMGQAGAIRLGLARALRIYDANVEPILREHNYLTRDPREVERKKYGQSGARRKFQFSKR